MQYALLFLVLLYLLPLEAAAQLGRAFGETMLELRKGK